MRHVRNCPSPTATSSLAIANIVTDEVTKRLVSEIEELTAVEYKVADQVAIDVQSLSANTRWSANYITAPQSWHELLKLFDRGGYAEASLNLAYSGFEILGDQLPETSAKGFKYKNIKTIVL